jgi:LmbE family N-acetylglucosaminyl deacetylase
MVYPVTLGRHGDHERRHEELVRSCRVAGLKLLDSEPLDMSAGEKDDLHAAATELTDGLAKYLETVDVISAPSPRDVHPAHEAIAAATARAIENAGGDRRLWLWSIWGTVPRPTLWFPYHEELLDRQLAALAEHRSQVVRNDFQRLVRGRAEAASVLGPELLFGFGVQAPSEPYAELLCEAVYRHGVWHAGRERQLDAGDPLGGADAYYEHVLAGSWVR